ncbi:MAG: hypothetical protein WBB23_22760 [Desulforhopalus sp.]
MSEYQYYNFRAIDNPLSPEQMEHLRNISSRAEITPVSFVNEYYWGDLHANPRDLMLDFFDIHVYLANWGSAVLMLRLPREALDKQTLEAFTVDSYFEVESVSDYWLLTWSLGESNDYDLFEEGEGDSWMTRLAPLREELLRGDLRSLYIGWLQAVTVVESMDEEQEPMALDSLGNLTAAQQALAEFLAVDPDLLAGAGIGSRTDTRKEKDGVAHNAWLDTLSREEIQRYLHQMLTGQGAQAERSLQRNFAAWQSEANPDTQMCRTVEELWQLADQSQKVRLAQQAKARKKAEAETRRKRETYLTLMAKNFGGAWKVVHKDADRGCASGYDSACRQLIDLRDAYDLQGNRNIFQQEFKNFLSEHKQRKALMTRLKSAGIL